MSKYLKAAHCALPLLALVLASTVASASNWQAHERILATAVDCVRAQSIASAEVEASPLDTRLRLPSCQWPLSATSNGTAARGAWNIAVSCKQGAGNPTLWTVHVPVRVRDMRAVVVLSQAVPAGQALAAQQLVLQPRDISTLGYGYLESLHQAEGQALRRPLIAGTVLTPDALAAVTLIRRGSLVQLVSQSDGFTVHSEGKALQDGSRGERITVENSSSHRVVQGVVRDKGTVEVSL